MTQISHISRRAFISGAAGLGLMGVLGWPGLALAALPTNKRLLLVILRGAMDGLGAIPAIGDPAYHTARGALAMPDTGLLALDRHFAMHKALGPLHQFYQKGELAVLHAAATPYRDRSHFDAQDLLENGALKPHQMSSGWLGRTIAAMGGGVQGLAMGASIPLVLHGSSQVQSWAPSILPEADTDFMERVARMYRHDPLLTGALTQGQAMGDANGAVGKGNRQFVDLMKVAAGFMKKDTGARIGSIDLGGWDTHAGQGTETGRLAQALTQLAEGVAAFRAEMGPLWQDCAVLMLTEFGRTVAVNGSGGTDHGTASVAMLAGGGLKGGGRIHGDWPGLERDKLFEGRDLYPVNDVRSLVKSVLHQHLGLPSEVVSRDVLPSSTQIRDIPGMFL